MVRDPIPNDPSDDELESLAEDLFGVSLNDSSDEVEPFDVGEFDLDDEGGAADEVTATAESDAPSAAVADEHAEPSTAASFVETTEEVDDFGAMLLDDDDASPPPPKVVNAPPTPATPTSRERPTREDQTEIKPPDNAKESEKVPESKDEDDGYWDALAGFEWDDDEGEESVKSASRKEYVETSETFEDLSFESAEKSDEFLDDADFGAGLDDDAAAEIAATKNEETRDAEATEEDAERRGRRRRRGGRRRGRRGRSQDHDEPTDEVGDESADDSLPRKEPPVAEDSDSAEGDGFGAGLDVETEDKEEAAIKEEPPKRRRRGGRRRGRRKSKEVSETATAAEDREPTKDDREPRSKKQVGTSGGTDPDRQKDKYRSVPTWEEAISYLVRKEPRKSSNGSESGSKSRRGQRGSRRRKN